MKDNELEGTDEMDVELPLLGTHRTSSKLSWIQRHRRVLYGSGFIVTLAICALLIVNSQMHRIAIAAIAGTTMSVRSMQLTHPLASSVQLSLELVVHSPSMFAAQLAPTNYTIRYHNGTAGIFTAPSMKICRGENIQRFHNTMLSITNKTIWDVFAKDLMQSNLLTYKIEGLVAISVPLLGGLWTLHAYDVPLVKALHSDGMNGLRVMTIADMDMTTSTSTQVRAAIKTCLYNPSTVTLHPVGQICMNGYYPTIGYKSHVAHLMTDENASLSIGRDDPSHPYCASIPNAVNMSHGYNLLELNGVMLGTYSETISALISKFLSHQPASMVVSACQPTATSVSIYNEAMKDLRIPIILPPRKESLVERMFFDHITLEKPVAGHENESISLTTGVIVEASSPLGILSPLELNEIHLKVDLVTNTTIGTLTSFHMEIKNGTLVDISNITVECGGRLDFSDGGHSFGIFVQESIQNTSLELHLTGEMNVVATGALGRLHLNGLPMDARTTMAGMDHFKRVSIESFVLPGDRLIKPYGEVVETKVSIWNPSLFSVSIGQVTMDLLLTESNEKLGELGGAMTLSHGINPLHLDGQIQPQLNPVGRVSSSVARFFSDYLRGQSTKISVQIQAIAYPQCQWMTNALIGLRIDTDFAGVPKGFQLISNLHMRQLDVQLDIGSGSNVTNTVMRVRTDLTATVKMPDSIQIAFNLSNLSVAVDLQDEATRAMGTLTSDQEVCEFKQKENGYFRLNMQHSYPLTLTSTDQVVVMAKFITNLLTTSGNVTMRLSTLRMNEGAFPNVETHMGMLPLKQIPIIGASVLPTMNSFRNPPVQIKSIDIKHGFSSHMELLMTFSIVNPSIVRTVLGTLVLHVLAEGVYMGVATVDHFELSCCGKPTVLNGTFRFEPNDSTHAVRFLSNFVSGYFTNGKPQEISIVGSPHSTDLDLLKPAIQALDMTTSVPTLGDLFPATPTLVSSSFLYPPTILHFNHIPTALELRNPFSENITVTFVDLLLYPCEQQHKGM